MYGVISSLYESIKLLNFIKNTKFTDITDNIKINIKNIYTLFILLYIGI